MNQDNFKNVNSKISSECDSLIPNIRDNIQKYIMNNNLSVRKFIDLTGLPSSTVNSLLYGDTTDCKLSTAVALAKTMGVSLNELTDAGTIDSIVQQNIITCRNLPQNSIYLIRWFINHQATLYKQEKKTGKKIISVMQPLYTNDGVAKVTNNFLQIDISEQSKDLQTKVFFGIRIGSDLLIPYYFKYDVLLIANDRAPLPREHVVILIGNNLYLAKQRYENGHFNYYGIRDNKFRCDESGIDEVIGYVTGVTVDATEPGDR